MAHTHAKRITTQVKGTFPSSGEWHQNTQFLFSRWMKNCAKGGYPLSTILPFRIYPCAGVALRWMERLTYCRVTSQAISPLECTYKTCIPQEPCGFHAGTILWSKHIPSYPGIAGCTNAVRGLLAWTFLLLLYSTLNGHLVYSNLPNYKPVSTQRR